ncbi:762_t:CDS:2 [Cetraspora pellucida]|uniref:762_t:CDS:1 n=1 Tax=Cetraspora pellucida TaxID=1433469 RepID=A0A9N9FNN0_9GLOM|nr:762_t:CDS:2 [Cetraspora pellucida]
MQSEINLLKQEDIRLMAKIAALEQITKEKISLSKNAQIKDSSEQVINTIFNTSNFNKTFFEKSKSLKDKEIDIILDLKNKKRVKCSTGSKKTITSLLLYDMKTVTKYYNLNNSDTTSEILKSDNQIIKEFENKVKSLIADGQIKDKTAKLKIYREMKPFLPNITDANLRKKAKRAQKILKLFGKEVDIDKINYITYSASTISRLKDIQIQYIINQLKYQQSLYQKLKEFSSKKFDYYRIIDKLLCLACKSSHRNEKSIRSRYEAESYFIKCEQQKIEITA